MSSLSIGDLPSDVTAAIRRCLTDYAGCALGGSRSEAGRIVHKVAATWGGPDEATLIGSPLRLSAKNAVFANATSANALDFDDTLHGHPGATTFPVAVALGEREGLADDDFVTAVAAGYEVAARAMSYLQPAVPRFEGLWDLGTLQSYGAAATAGRMLQMTPNEIEQLFGLVSGTAPVPLPRKSREVQGPRSMLKSAYGWSCMTAVVASDLIRHGFTAPMGAFDDSMGFWRRSPGEKGGGSPMISDLGSTWAILDTEFKPFMACRFLHPAIQALSDILGSSGVAAEEIRSIQVKSYDLLGDEYHFEPRPSSATDAQFSLPYVLAALACHGRLDVSAYNLESLQNEGMLGLSSRIEFEIDRRYQASFPEKYGAEVVVILDDGRALSSAVDHPRGSPEMPLTDEEVRTKYALLAVPVLGEKRAEGLLALIEDIPVINVRRLGAAMGQVSS